MFQQIAWTNASSIMMFLQHYLHADDTSVVTERPLRIALDLNRLSSSNPLRINGAVHHSDAAEVGQLIVSQIQLNPG